MSYQKLCSFYTVKNMSFDSELSRDPYKNNTHTRALALSVRATHTTTAARFCYRNRYLCIEYLLLNIDESVTLHAPL